MQVLTNISNDASTALQQTELKTEINHRQIRMILLHHENDCNQCGAYKLAIYSIFLKLGGPWWQ